MSQITDQEVVFSSQYLVTLERSSNRHATAIINQEISELAGLVEEIQLSQDSEGSEGEQTIRNDERVYGETGRSNRGRGRGEEGGVEEEEEEVCLHDSHQHTCVYTHGKYPKTP